MWELIILAVVIFVSVNQNNRISKLERLIRERTNASETSAPEKINSVSPVTETDIRNELLSPSLSSSKSEEVSMNVPPAISKEEASGRFLGKIGVGAVLLGVAFFLKYAFDSNWIGPAGRVMIGVLFGVAFLAVGQMLRKKYLRYSDLIMGGGIGILYLSVYSAQAFYHLIDPFLTLLFMSAVTVLAFAVSIVNATATLAVVGIVGGFATPFLSGAGGDNMFLLFGYMTILNFGVLAVSFFKKWPKLVAFAFSGTAINLIIWMGENYKDELLAPTFFFLFISFIIFLVASIARAVSAGVKADSADYFLLGADAFGFAMLSYILLDPNYHNLLGFGAVVIAVIYMLVAYLANKFNSADAALNIFLPGLAVTFLSIAVPLQFSGPWIAAAWLVEACALYFIASIISNRGFQIMGIVVYCLGLLDALQWYVGKGSADMVNFLPIFNSTFAILALAVLVAYLISFMYVKFGSITPLIRERGITVFIVVANILTILALTIQITGYHEAKILKVSNDYNQNSQQSALYNTGYDTSNQRQQASETYYKERTSIKNQSNTSVSIFWALYAALLTGIGFAKRFAGVRRLGLILFVITGLKVLVDVWSLGQLYRIISFIVFGIIALIASFGYAKYKDRLKAIVVITLMLLSGLSYSPVHAESKLSNWQYERVISSTPISDFAKIVLPDDISKSGADFNDIRIIDQSGNEAPYLVTRGVSQRGGVVNARILNKSFIGGSTYFIAEVPNDANVRTGVTLSTINSNFKRQVSVYASNSLLPLESFGWALVTSDGYIFKFTDSVTGFSSGKDSINFSPNTSRYYKIVVGDGDEGAVDVSGATFQGDTSIIAPKYSKNYPVTIFNNPEKRTTEITLDFGSEGFLSDALSINSTDKNYSRKVIVEASNDGVTWNFLSQSYISSVSTSRFTGSSNKITYPEQSARYIRVSIVNDDNRPIAVGGNATVEGPIVSAIFENRPGENYTLYYGNGQAEKPVYDIARISSYIEENSIPSVSLGAEALNPTYVAPKGPVVPFTESNKWLLNTILVLVVLVLGVGIGLYLMHYKNKSGLVNKPKGFESENQNDNANNSD